MTDRSKYLPSDENARNSFVRHLLRDIEALDRMLADGLFESGMRRIGAEQEFCLIDYDLRPAMLAMEMLEGLDDEQFTTELALFNLELNLDPLAFEGRCLSTLENQLIQKLTRANRHAHRLGGKVILSGILPTVRASDITLDNMTPIPRYRALNEALRDLRGRDFEFNIRGIDELVTRSSTVLFESCNTSFQVHYQIDPADYCADYNWALAISGPVLAAATNSPVFLGKRLWHETRIALFHQSTDARSAENHLRQQRPRVTFGQRWETGSPADAFRELVTHHRVLLTPEIDEDSCALLDAGSVPKLRALALHNGTIYKWNRLCFGVTDARPHLRIECRYLPSGPSIVDEVANAAFWFGLMRGRPLTSMQLTESLRFDDAKSNFVQAARLGLDTRFHWLGRESVDARELIVAELLPIARQGLADAGIRAADIDKYLGTIEARVDSGGTGSRWMLDAFASLRDSASLVTVLDAITDGIYRHQRAGLPVHLWTKLDPGHTDIHEGPERYRIVEQLMSTELITVGEDDLAELALNMMSWSNIHHIPVENPKGELVGLVSIRHLAEMHPEPGASTLVRDIMDRDIETVAPTTPVAEALSVMHEREIDCLPVVNEDKLVGIITDRDYAKIARLMVS